MSLTDRHGKPRQCDCGNAATRIAVGNSYQCDRCAAIEQAMRFSEEHRALRAHHQTIEPFRLRLPQTAVNECFAA